MESLISSDLFFSWSDDMARGLQLQIPVCESGFGFDFSLFNCIMLSDMFHSLLCEIWCGNFILTSGYRSYSFFIKLIMLKKIFTKNWIEWDTKINWEINYTNPFNKKGTRINIIHLASFIIDIFIAILSERLLWQHCLMSGNCSSAENSFDLNNW